MIPDLPELVHALIGLVATSREGLAVGGVALLSVANDLLIYVRGGSVSDVRKAKDVLLDGMKARVENRRADTLLKNATALKTVAEAVRIANGAPDSAGESAGVRRESRENFERALNVLRLFGGELMADSQNLERIIGSNSRIEGTAQARPAHLEAIVTATGHFGIGGSASLSVGPAKTGESEPLEAPPDHTP